MPHAILEAAYSLMRLFTTLVLLLGSPILGKGAQYNNASSLFYYTQWKTYFHSNVIKSDIFQSDRNLPSAFSRWYCISSFG